MSASWRTARGVSPSPQVFSRGKTFFSTTRRPSRPGPTSSRRRSRPARRPPPPRRRRARRDRPGAALAAARGPPRLGVGARPFLVAAAFLVAAVFLVGLAFLVGPPSWPPPSSWSGSLLADTAFLAPPSSWPGSPSWPVRWEGSRREPSRGIVGPRGASDQQADVPWQESHGRNGSPWTSTSRS